MTTEFEQHKEHAQTTVNDLVGTKNLCFLETHCLKRRDIDIRTMPNVVHNQFKNPALLRRPPVTKINS